MANFFKLEHSLVVNDAAGNRRQFDPGMYVLTEADGSLSACVEDELEANIARVDADIVARDAQIEAERLAAEQAAQTVADDKGALTSDMIRGENADLDNVTVSLNLVTSLPGGSSVSWASNNEAVGIDGTVTRSTEDVGVVLTGQ